MLSFPLTQWNPCTSKVLESYRHTQNRCSIKNIDHWKRRRRPAIWSELRKCYNVFTVMCYVWSWCGYYHQILLPECWKDWYLRHPHPPLDSHQQMFSFTYQILMKFLRVSMWHKTLLFWKRNYIFLLEKWNELCSLPKVQSAFYKGLILQILK